MSLPRKSSLKQLMAVFRKSKKTQPKTGLKNYPNGYVEKNVLDGPVQSYEDFMRTKK